MVSGRGVGMRWPAAGRKEVLSASLPGVKFREAGPSFPLSWQTLAFWPAARHMARASEPGGERVAPSLGPN